VQPREIKKNSWHYRLVTTYAMGSHIELDNEDVNICEYIRNIFKGAFIALVVVFLVGFPAGCAAGCVASALIYFGVWIAIAYPGDPSIVTTIGILTMALTLIGFISAGLVWLRNYVPTNPGRDPGFITEAYRSYKNKFCFYIKAVD